MNNSSRARPQREAKPQFEEGKYMEIENVPAHRKTKR